MDKRIAVLDAVEKMKTGNYKATAIKVELEADLCRDEDEDSCLRSILNFVASHLGTEWNDENYNDESYDNMAESFSPLPGVAYARFYNDGSVDSELTFTIKLDNPENIFLLEVFIDAFKSMADDYGSEFDTSGAGMHMALLNNADYGYPSDEQQNDHNEFFNFRKSMTLLLPALYFLGTPNSKSRGLEYRRPEIGSASVSHGYDKFNAIHFKDGGLEFRVFDTCYENPEVILDNVVVMANCMKYWRSTYRDPGMAKVCRRVQFGVDRGYELSRFYTSVEHIDLLNKGLLRLKPSYLTIKELKQQRHFTENKSRIANRGKRYAKQVAGQYKEYEERFTWKLEYYRHSYIADHCNNVTQVDMKAVEVGAEKYVQEQAQQKQDKQSYITTQLTRMLDINNGEFALEV